MTKQILINVSNIKQTNDREFVYQIIDDIIESLYDFEGTVTEISLDRKTDSYDISFTSKVSKEGDILFILLKEWLSLLLETENNLSISLKEIEDSDNSIMFVLYKCK